MCLLLSCRPQYVRVPYREVYEPPPEDTEALPDMEAQIHAGVCSIQIPVENLLLLSRVAN